MTLPISLATNTASTLLTKVKTFYGNHKGPVLLAIAMVLLLLASFYLGRRMAPSKIVTQTKTVEKAVDRIVYQDRVVTKIVYVKDKKTHVHIVTVTTQKPDGEKVTQKTEDENSDTEVNEDTNKDQNIAKNETKTDNTSTQSKTTTTYKSPNWMVGAKIGISIPVLFMGKTQQGIPGLDGAVIQAEVGRKLIGPLWFTVHGDTQGVVGLGLTGIF